MNFFGFYVTPKIVIEGLTIGIVGLAVYRLLFWLGYLVAIGG